jgi:hypothetical protein
VLSRSEGRGYSAAALLGSTLLRFQALDPSSGNKRLERVGVRGEAALYSPQSSKAWVGGASGGLVCVERTLLSAALDSSPKKRGWSRSNNTGKHPDAKSREFIPPFGGATRPKSPALRFAIGRVTPPDGPCKCGNIESSENRHTSGALRISSKLSCQPSLLQPKYSAAHDSAPNDDVHSIGSWPEGL